MMAHRQERRAAQERNDAETIVDGRRDVEHEHLAADERRGQASTDLQEHRLDRGRAALTCYEFRAS